MKVQTIFITASLAIQKKLAKLTRPKRRPNHPIIQNELVYRQNSYSRFSCTAKCQVCWI